MANVQPQIDVNALQGGRIAAAIKVNRIVVYSYRIFFIAIIKIFMISAVFQKRNYFPIISSKIICRI